MWTRNYQLRCHSLHQKQGLVTKGATLNFATYYTFSARSFISVWVLLSPQLSIHQGKCNKSWTLLRHCPIYPSSQLWSFTSFWPDPSFEAVQRCTGGSREVEETSPTPSGPRCPRSPPCYASKATLLCFPGKNALQGDGRNSAQATPLRNCKTLLRSFASHVMRFQRKK